MLKAVLDTNVIVSGTISSSGAPFEILEAWRNRKFILVTSPPVLKEIQRVFEYPKIKKSYSLDTKTIANILAVLHKYSLVTPGKLKMDEITTDPSDNMFLVCAKEAEADFVVTGDAHILNLRVFEDTRIVAPRQFLEFIKERAD